MKGFLSCRHVAATVGGHYIVFERVLGACVLSDLPAVLPWVGKVHNGFTGVEESLSVLCSGRLFLNC